MLVRLPRDPIQIPFGGRVQAVAVGIDALLASLAALPQPITLGTLGRLRPWGGID